MSTTPRERLHTRWVRSVVIADFVLLLFPPLQWAFSHGDPVASTLWSVGSAAVVTATLPLLRRLSRTERQEG
ncbi:hypothetical protein [Kineococcus sp. NPDC059986]|uniref:hypothetical protein n=1 Tax=Kineococcus sp. NPDC059986 TaxID=3155538 RepID=UPI00344B729A